MLNILKDQIFRFCTKFDSLIQLSKKKWNFKKLGFDTF